MACPENTRQIPVNIKTSSMYNMQKFINLHMILKKQQK